MISLAKLCLMKDGIQNNIKVNHNQLKKMFQNVLLVVVLTLKRFLGYQKQVVLRCGDYFQGKYINNGIAIIAEVNGKN